MEEKRLFIIFPHGFESMAPNTEKAGQIEEMHFCSLLIQTRGGHNDDDRMTAHYVTISCKPGKTTI